MEPLDQYLVENLVLLFLGDAVCTSLFSYLCLIISGVTDVLVAELEMLNQISVCTKKNMSSCLIIDQI